MHRARPLVLVSTLALVVAASPPGVSSAPALDPTLARPAWFWSSPPLSDEGDSQGTTYPPLVQVNEHCRLEWYNPHGDVRGVKEHDLNPILTNAEGGDNEHTTLEMRITPPTGQTQIVPGNWAGITQAPWPAGVDLSGLAYLAIWVNDLTPAHSLTRARLHVDLGRISEDAFWNPDSVPNGKLDTEDKNGDAKLDRSDDLAVDEDTGLDGLHDVEEPGYDAATNPDPHHDDYPDPLPSDYNGINNLEGNGKGDPNAHPDTEDLNRDGFPNFQDDYFEATIDLSDTFFVAIDVPRDYPGNPNVKPDNGWRLFRIPLTADVFKPVNSASWENVQHVRLWVNGMSAPIRLQVGGMEFLDASGRGAPRALLLEQNAPNPFNPSTRIRYELPSEGRVQLRVYDIRGRLIRTLYEGNRPAGRYEAAWNGEDEAGRRAPSGVYWYKLEAAGASQVRSMVLAR